MPISDEKNGSRDVIKIIFIDLDDTILTPPHAAVAKSAKIFFRVNNFPTEEELINRNNIHYFRSHPAIFKSPTRMWAMAIAAIPFGLVSCQKPHTNLDIEGFKKLLTDQRVYILSQNPPFLSRFRSAHLEKLFGISLGFRYIPCGPINGSGPSKAKIIKTILELNNLKPSSCLLIDDSGDTIAACDKLGIKTALIDTAWNQKIKIGSGCRISRASLVKKANDFLSDKEPVNLISGTNIHVYYEQSIFDNWLKKYIKTMEIKFRYKLSIQVLKVNKFGGLSEKSLKNGNQFLWTKWKFAVPISNAVSFRKVISILDQLESGVDYKISKTKKILRWTEQYTAKQLVGYLFPESQKEMYRKYKHVVSSRSPAGVYFLNLIYKVMESIIFRKIEVTNNIDIRNLEKHTFVIYTPQHRSIYDSALLMRVLAECGMSMPIIPAADKMRNTMVGFWGRFIGTFYIVRQRASRDYNELIYKIVDHAVMNSNSSAIFLEGQRSRSGRTLMPKTGILRLFLRSAKQRGINVTLVPMAFCYNRLPESEQLFDEVIEDLKNSEGSNAKLDSDLLIRKKKKVGIRWLTKLIKWIGGGVVSDAYVTFGQPVSINWDSINRDISEKSILNEVAEKVMRNANNAVVPLATSIVCFALQYAENNHMNMQQLDRFLSFSSFLISRFSGSKYNRIKSQKNRDFLEELNDLPFINRKFKNAGVVQRRYISLTDLDVVLAKHYANNMLHFFAQAGLVARLIVTKSIGNIDEVVAKYERSLPIILDRFMISRSSQADPRHLICAFAVFGGIKIEGGRYSILPRDPNSPFDIITEFVDKTFDFVFEENIALKIRREPRVQVRFSVNIQVDGEDHEAEIVDLSNNGGALITKAVPAQGAEIFLRFSPVDDLRKAHIVRINGETLGFRFVL